jgi:hypothetical protein
MKTSELKALGLSDDQISSVMALGGRDVGSLKDQLTAAQQETTGLTSQLNERDGQLAELQKSTGDAEALQKQIATLQEQNKAQAAAHQKDLATMRVNHAVEQALTGARAKNLTAAKALLADFLAKAELGRQRQG